MGAHLRRGLAPIGALVATASAMAAGGVPPSAHVGKQPDGSYVTSTNQRLTPWGQQVEVGEARPTAAVVNPAGTKVAFLSGDGLGGPEVIQVDLATLQPTPLDTGLSNGSFDGIAYSRDGATIYAADSGGTVHVVDATTGVGPATTTISMPKAAGDKTSKGPNPGGLAVSDDGTRLVVALNRNNSVGVVDLQTRAVTEIPVGVAPHSVLVRGDTVFVTNEGGRRPVPGDVTNMSSGSAVVVDPERGAASTGTVSVVSLAARKVVASIDVGLHPTALTQAFGMVFVVNTNSDTVSVIDPGTLKVTSSFSIVPFPNAPYGSSPTGIAGLPDGRLAVTLGRDNAVAVYSRGGPGQAVSLDGLLPTGWYPSAVVVDTAGKRLVVANDKGVGSIRGSQLDPTGRIPERVQEYLASASFMPLPTAADLQRGSLQVVGNNGWDAIDTACPRDAAVPVAIPAHVGEPSLIHHVFYVIKENRTYDQVLGDDLRGNGDPAEVMYGRAVTPNEHAMATQFPLLDNFYDSGSLSADGHQWAVQADAPDYLEKDFTFPRSYPAFGFDALTYLPSGFLWEAAQRAGRSVTNYAEYGIEGGVLPEYSDVPSNDRTMVRDYPGFDLTISDQHRADIFLKHFADDVARGRLADLTFIRLPDDHTSGTAVGTHTPASEVADNDLALGRIVDAISHSAYWKDSAVFVEEDDSQDGSDHVDGHRSTGFVISPYARHGVVDSTYYTQVNVVRTIEQILGLTPMNQMDLAATPMRTAFSDTPDTTPYTVIANPLVNAHVNPPLAQLTGLSREWAEASSAQDLGHSDAADQRILNRAAWYALKGDDVPYPGDGRVLHPAEVAPRGGSVLAAAGAGVAGAAAGPPSGAAGGGAEASPPMVSGFVSSAGAGSGRSATAACPAGPGAGSTWGAGGSAGTTAGSGVQGGNATSDPGAAQLGTIPLPLTAPAGEPALVTLLCLGALAAAAGAARRRSTGGGRGPR